MAYWIMLGNSRDGLRYMCSCCGTGYMHEPSRHTCPNCRQQIVGTSDLTDKEDEPWASFTTRSS